MLMDNIKSIPDSEIIEKGARVLINELYYIGYIRFMRMFDHGEGNYLNVQHKIFEGMSVREIYGDGRAISAVRGYAEQNLENLSYWEYSQLRYVVSQLGGDMSDLDEYFDAEDEEYVDESDEEEYLNT